MSTITIVNYIIFLVLFFYLSRKIFSVINALIKLINRKFLFQRLIELYTVYDNVKDNAFKSLHKQHISVIYSSKLSGHEKKDLIKKYEETYIKRVIDMCGESIIEDLAIISGSTDTIVLDLSNFYSEKILQLETGDFEMEVQEQFGVEPDELKTLNAGN